MDNVFTVECTVSLQRVVCPKAISIDSQRLLWWSASRSRIVDSSAAFAGITYRWSVTILLGAVVFENYAFLKANAELQRQMKVYGWLGYRQTFSRTSDLTTLTALTEDTVALLGLSTALIGIVAARLTGNPAPRPQS